MLPRTVLRAELVEYIERLGRIVLELRESTLRREGELAERAAALARSEGVLAERQRQLEVAFRELERQRLELAELARRLQLEQAALEAQREVLRQKEEALAARQALLEQQEEVLRQRRERSPGGRQQGGPGPGLRVSTAPVLSAPAEPVAVREVAGGEAEEPARGAGLRPETPQPAAPAPAPADPPGPAGTREVRGSLPDAPVLARVIGPTGEVQTVQPTVHWGIGEGQVP